MTTWINTTHRTLSGATKPLCIDDIAAKQYDANPTKAQTKAVERELKALHKAGLLESTPGRGGLPHYSLITPTAEPAPQPKPSAAAVAVHAALDGGTDPAPDLAEQLRHAHAERLAMSQTIIAICCAIGRDPGQTTTAELPQALRDYIDGQIEREKAEHAGAIADIRAAIGDDGRLPLSEIAGKIKEALTALGLDSYVLDVIRNTLASHAADLVPDCGATTTEPEAIRIMAQLIDTQHAHLLAQSAQLDTQATDLESATRLHLACNGLTNDLMEPAGPFYDQAQGLRAAAMLIDAQHTHLHAQSVEIETQAADLDDAARKIATQEQQIAELRSRVEAQILAGHESASSASRLLTEVHEVLSTSWPEGWERPTGRTTLQLAQALKTDFGALYGEYLDKKAPTPDAYLVTRHLRAGRGKTVADTDGPTRHKSIDTATRKARAAIRGGYVRAEIHATNLVAVATLGAEIKPV